MNILFFLTPKSEVAYLYDTDSLAQALEKMESHRYSAIPIIGEVSGKYLGTLTEGDLLWHIKNSIPFNIPGVIIVLSKQDIPFFLCLCVGDWDLF